VSPLFLLLRVALDNVEFFVPESADANVPDERVELVDRGIDVAQAEDLRFRLSAFAEDWDRPEMDVYDQM